MYLVQPLAQPDPTMLFTVTATQLPRDVVSGFMCDGFAKFTLAGLGILYAAAAFEAAMSPVPASHDCQRAIAISVDFWASMAALGRDQVDLPRGAFLKSPPPDQGLGFKTGARFKILKIETRR